MQKSKDKKQTGNPKKLRESINKPSDILLKFIEDANLVQFDANLDFDLPDNAISFGVSFSSWADQHNLKQYPKLFERLSNVENEGYFWQVAINEIKKNREFLKIFVEIAEKYQEKLRRTAESERLIKLGIEHLRGRDTKALEEFRIKFFEEFGVEPPEESTLLGGEMFFKISNEKPFLGLRLFDETKDELAERLFKIAFGFFSLAADKNHRANISVGDFFAVINGTDLRRLKKCIVCSNIFWAYRLNAKFCLKECSNLFHQNLLMGNPKKKAVVNARRSKTRFEEKVKDASKQLAAAKTEFEKREMEKRRDKAISNRTYAARKLENLKNELKEGEQE